MQGAGERAFCAGIDLRELMKNPNIFDAVTYSSNTMDLISRYKKPYTAIIDGITMGGACFFSMTSKYRIATERTVFAMPETEIGFFTNAGASYFLPRLNYNLGYYVALAGARLYGYDVKKFGLASHFIESKRMEDFKKALVSCKDDYEVGKTIANYSTVPVCTDSELDEVMPRIDKCFDGDSVEEIYDNLGLDGSEWAMQTIRVLNRMSPKSMKLSHRLLKMGSKLSLKECLKLEMIITYNIMNHFPQDFREGVRALIIDKDLKPKWNPKVLHDIKDEDVDKIFASIPEEFELKFDSDIKNSKL
ncbi:3-hydroxyisobutyryl-CoA hydrolase, mitochondrial-like isoform X2 [Chironomus tepperi]